MPADLPHNTIEAHGASQALEELLSAVAAGQREALGQLYRLTRAAVYAAALAILRNGDEAQDVAQDVYVRVWESAPQYRPQGAPMAWLLTVTRNLAKMRLRSLSRQTQLSDGEWQAIPAQAPGVTAEDRHVLQGALAALSDGERQAVLLHATAGLKHREIAQVLGMPLPTVLSKYTRALRKMREWMEKGGETL